MESVICSDDDHNPNWKLNKANWELFHTMCDNELSVEHFSDSSNIVADFTASLMNISNKCIPKTSIIQRKANHGLMRTVKKLLNNVNKHYRNSARTNQNRN